MENFSFFLKLLACHSSLPLVFIRKIVYIHGIGMARYTGKQPIVKVAKFRNVTSDYMKKNHHVAVRGVQHVNRALFCLYIAL